MVKIPELGHQCKFWLLGIAECCILFLTCEATTRGAPGHFDTSSFAFRSSTGSHERENHTKKKKKPKQTKTKISILILNFYGFVIFAIFFIYLLSI